MNGEQQSRNLVHFVKPKHLELQKPDINLSLVAKQGNRSVLSLKSSGAALWAWITVPGKEITLSDNYFHLRPDEAVEIAVDCEHDLSLEDIVVRSLIDVWQEN